MDLLFFTVMCLLCLCTRLFICALWSSVGKGLTSWLSFAVSNCEFATFPFRVGSHVVSVRMHCTEKWRTSFHTDVLSKSK